MGNKYIANDAKKIKKLKAELRDLHENWIVLPLRVEVF